MSIDQVVSSGVCVGCGGCNTATEGRIPVQMNGLGFYQADLTGVSDADKEIGSRVCPFSGDSPNEDEIAEKHYPGIPHDPRLGRHLGRYAGRITDDAQIPGNSSGGLTTWLLSKLLDRGDVDGVIHIGQTDNPLFGYVVSTSLDDLQGRRKSQYHPATFGEVLQGIRGDGRRYAFVAIPCAMRSARLVCLEDAVLAEQLAYFVGIVCGHLKSAAYAESFAWQVGVPPQDIDTVDFRIKNPALTSRQYSFGVRSKSTGEWAERETLSLLGGSWGHAVFQLDACNYCDDIFAETADVVFGDAWLPKYEIDWRGTNVVITRNEHLDSLLREGREGGQIMLDDLDADAVARTQAGNFRHRREGLAVRLADDAAAGRWSPPKRVEAGYDGVDEERIALIRQRRILSAKSHGLFAGAKSEGDLALYMDGMRPLIDSYQNATKMAFSTRVRNKVKRETWKIVRKLGRG